MAFHNDDFINQIRDLIREDFTNSNMYKWTNPSIEKIRQIAGFDLATTRTYLVFS
jgi:hypothetical protein